MKPMVITVVRVVAVTVVALIAIWMLSRLEIGEAWRTARTADLSLLAVAVALMVVSLGMRVARSIVLFRSCGWNEIPARSVGLVTLIGFALSKVTPGGSGDLLRAAAFRRHDVRPLDVAAVVIYERGLDLLVMLALLGIGLLALLAGWPVTVVVTVATLAAGLGLVRPVLRVLTALPLIMPAAAVRLQLSFNSPALQPLLHARVGSMAALLTVANFASESLRAYLVYRALGLETGVAGVLVLLLLPYTVALLTLIPLGLGSWDATAALAVERLGFPLEAGAAAALLLRAVLTVPTLLAGFAAWLVLRAEHAPLDAPPSAVPVEPSGAAGVRMQE